MQTTLANTEKDFACKVETFEAEMKEKRVLQDKLASMHTVNTEKLRNSKKTRKVIWLEVIAAMHQK